MFVQINQHHTQENEHHRNQSTCAFEIHGILGMDVEVSPDGKLLAVVGQKYSDSPAADGVRIFDIATKEPVAEFLTERFLNYPINCAWSTEGSTLAVTRNVLGEVDLFDSASWTIKHRFRLFGSDWMGSTCFDRKNNFYAATEDHYGVDDYPTRDRVVVWRHALEEPEIEAESIGTTVCNADRTNPAFSVSAATMETGTRVAISHNKCPVQILRLGEDEDGRLTEELEMDFPGIERAWVRLTPDGKHLATLETKQLQFSLYQLTEQRTAELVTKQTGLQPVQTGMFAILVRCLDISRDGRLVAFHFGDRIKVMRINDGKEVFETLQPTPVVGLSPDGKYLITCPVGEKRICFHEIPQEAADEAERVE